MFKKTVLQTIAFAAGTALLALPSIARAASPISRTSYHNDMRKLWEDHITWTRIYIVTAVADLPDQAAAAERLMQNQVDLGNAIKPFYGEAAGEKLTALLKDHIVIATQLIAAAKAGDHEKQADALSRWGANADEIAGFLSGANPRHWTVVEMKAMMHSHLEATTAEVTARLQKNWPADVAAYDQVHGQILMMADMISDGIIHQFPKNFK